EAELAATANLDRYLSYGLHHNAGLRAAYERWRADLERIPQVTSLPDPQLSFTQFVEEVQTRTGPQQRRYSLQQTLPWFGKLDQQGTVASARAEEQWQRVQAVRVEVARDIRVAYHDYAYLGESTAITRRVVGLLERLGDTVREKVRGGNDLAPLLRLEVEIARTRDLLQQLEKQRLAESAAIDALLGRRSSEPLPWPEPEETGDSERPDRDALLADLLTRNPELGALRSRVEKAAEAVKLSRKSPIPDPMIGAGFFDTGEAFHPGTAGGGDDPWAIQVGFSIPLWPGKYRAERREAESNREAAEHAREDRENLLVEELEADLQTLAEIDERLALYEKTLLPKARQAVEVTESSYKGDRATVLELIDSERTLLEIERAHRRAVADRAKALVRLQTLTGETLP
ncbi:MAG: TolC family protein, partial [Verrucomicrobiae bacterium]|nr:TolC family protein [Verrucomicrobiae bacterium]